jgi:O-antigen ligase
MIAIGRKQDWTWPLLISGAGALVGVLTGLNPKLAIAASLGLLFVLVILSDLTTGLAVFTFLSLVALVPLGAGPAVSFLKAAGLLLLLSWLATVARAGSDSTDFVSAHPGLSYAILLFLAWVALSLLWAESSSQTTTSLYRYALNAVLFLIIFTAVRGQRDLIKVIGAFVTGATVAAAYGFLQPPPTNEVERLAGTLGNANELATILVVGFVLGIGWAGVAKRSPAIRLAAAGCSATCLLGILLTLSRTGLVALAIAGVAAIVFGGRWRVKIVPVALIVATIGIGYFAVMASPEARERVTHAGNGTGRVDLWQVGRRMIDAHPINGVGAGNFPVASVHFLLQPGVLTRTDLIISEPKVAHNTYLEIFAELGAVGFALFVTVLLICLGCATKAIRIFRRCGDVDMELLARTLLVALVALLAADFFESEEFQKTLWLLLGLCPAILAIARSAAGGIPRLGR